MKWDTPKLIDLADRQSALNAVGFSCDPHTQGTGHTCQDGSHHHDICFTGGAASFGAGVHVDPA